MANTDEGRFQRKSETTNTYGLKLWPSGLCKWERFSDAGCALRQSDQPL